MEFLFVLVFFWLEKKIGKLDGQIGTFQFRLLVQCQFHQFRHDRLEFGQFCGFSWNSIQQLLNFESLQPILGKFQPILSKFQPILANFHSNYKWIKPISTDFNQF